MTAAGPSRWKISATMPSVDPSPARLFAALGDATRLGMIGRLSDGGERSIGPLGDGLPISRQAVAKHLDVLLGAGLVTRTRSGRAALLDRKSTRMNSSH